MNTKRIAATLRGFTPVPDLLVQEFDLMTATVWGRVWRYCQLSDGFCRASLQTIASDLGISKRKVRYSLGKLVQDGYLRKESRPGKPSRYFDTGEVSIEMGIGVESRPRHDVPRTPAPDARVPRHDVPRTPAPRATKDTKEDTELRNREEDTTTTGGSAAAAVVDFLFSKGIKPRKKARELASLDHVTLDRAQAEWDSAQDGENPVGLLIYALENDVPAKDIVGPSADDQLREALGLDPREGGENRHEYQRQVDDA